MAPIVVLGSLNVDFVARVPVLPGPGETVLGGDLGTFAGGKGANQAVAAARLGGRVAMVGCVGADAHGDLLVRRLELDGVDAGGVRRDPDAPTGAALIMVAAGGENVIAVTPGANARVGARDVRRAVAALDAGGLLLLQLEVPLAAVEQAIREARAAGGRVLLNTAPAARLDLDRLAGLEAVVANESEAAAPRRRATRSWALWRPDWPGALRTRPRCGWPVPPAPPQPRAPGPRRPCRARPTCAGCSTWSGRRPRSEPGGRVEWPAAAVRAGGRVEWPAAAVRAGIRVAWPAAAGPSRLRGSPQ